MLITLFIIKNASTYRVTQPAVGTDQNSCSFSCHARLNVGDTINVQASFVTSQVLNNSGDGNYTFFQVCWIRSY